MKTNNQRQRILNVEKKTIYHCYCIINYVSKYEVADLLYTVHTKKGCVAYNVSKKSFNTIPQPGLFIRLCKNKKQYEITGRNGR